jgi:hypothetical protein
MNNYFKVRGQFFFFNELDADDAQRAFDLARAVSNDISMFRPPRSVGPWDRVNVIGHRPRKQILSDIARTTSEDKLFWLKDELKNLDMAYFEAGRDCVPLSLVA